MLKINEYVEMYLDRSLCFDTQKAKIRNYESNEIENEGSIHITISDNQFNAVFFPDSKIPNSQVFSAHEIGQKIPDSSYSIIDFIDDYGYNWKSDRFIKYESTSYINQSTIYKFTFTKLETISRLPKSMKSSVLLFFPYSLKIPTNTQHEYIKKEIGSERKYTELNTWKYRSEKYKIALKQLGNGTEFYMDDYKGDIEVEKKIVSTMQFVFGQILNVALTYIIDKGYESLGIKIFDYSKEEKLFKPVNDISPFGGECLEELFIKYYEYLQKIDSSKSYYPPYLYLQILRSFSFLETGATVLALSIESIINNIVLSKKDNKISDDTINKIDSALKHIQIEDTLTKRIVNFINSIKGDHYSAAEILYFLADKNAIIENEIKYWKKLRHSVAHGKIYQFDLDELFELYAKNLLVYYKINYYLIGYSGKYTRYDEKEWPLK